MVAEEQEPVLRGLDGEVRGQAQRQDDRQGVNAIEAGYGSVENVGGTVRKGIRYAQAREFLHEDSGYGVSAKVSTTYGADTQIY